MPEVQIAQQYREYMPIPGGFKIEINGMDDPARLHRRPLYPPADKTMIWTAEELKQIERYSFRPLVLSRLAPQFIFDFHLAGGILGQLFAGLAEGEKKGKWFHEWETIKVVYTNGILRYELRDGMFPGVSVSMEASALAGSAGLILKTTITGACIGTKFVWCYGGASAFFTRYNFDAPEFEFDTSHCLKDDITTEKGMFCLERGFDESDVCMKEVLTAPKYLAGWKAGIHGGTYPAGNVGAADPEYVFGGPAKIVETVLSASGGRGLVAAGAVDCADANGLIYLAAGMGRELPARLGELPALWEEALARNDSISERIELSTPDLALDSAASMNSFCLEGIWGDEAVMHGAWSWRSAYPGWRGWYGVTCSGWTERIRKTIKNFIQRSLISEGYDKGAIGCLMEHRPYVYYNMNEVFLDQVRQYYDYTGDIELMEEIFPVLVGIAEWEDRCLKPGEEDLYESALNTWISDSHWYIKGQCAQASAYMYRAWSFLAELAVRLDKTPERFMAKAESIRKAMQDKLWLERKGVFAEYADTLGRRMLHEEPELPTLYHTAEFGAADELQTYQMMRWAEGSLKKETAFNGGSLVWSSRWFPNQGRSYTHSTLDLVYAEALNLAVTEYIAGRKEEAYALIKGSLCGFFSGPTPGGIPCHASVDGSQRMNDDFADAISMWTRTVCEGLFGIVPKMGDGTIRLSPSLPDSWDKASISTPLFSYEWKHANGSIEICWNAEAPVKVSLRLPVNAKKIITVRDNASDMKYIAAPGVGFTWVEAETQKASNGVMYIEYVPEAVMPPEVIKSVAGEKHVFPSAISLLDPQGLLDVCCMDETKTEAVITGAPGPGVFFALGGTDECPRYIPVWIEIAEKGPGLPVWSPLSDTDPREWKTIDLSDVFNASSPCEILKNVTENAVPPVKPYSNIGFEYWMIHLVRYVLNRVNPPSCEAFRQKTEENGYVMTEDGIPFLSSKQGRNMAAFTRAGAYPENISVAAEESGDELYLLITGVTYPNQSHVPNISVILRYEDGIDETHELQNPDRIGDCWGCMNMHKVYHDTPANGFENIGGRGGPAGSAHVADMDQPVLVDTEAHIVKLPLRKGMKVMTIELEAVSNDSIFALMGVSFRNMEGY